MVQRPYIRQGNALYSELRFSTRNWRELQTFLNGLHDNGTESERETHRVNHATLLAEIDTAAHEIYNQLNEDSKEALSEEGDLVYPGLARYPGAHIVLLISLDQADTLAAYCMF
jgi:hypothetical protein